jgi:hypothetical protein
MVGRFDMVGGLGTAGGSGGTGGRRRGGVRSHLAFALVVAVVLVGFGLIAVYRWRRGATLIGGALLLAGGLRAALSDGAAGLLAIRGRAVDVLAYTAFGLALVAVAVTID